MTQSQTTLATTHASRYLQQLCKHFGRKVPTTFSQTAGQITFPFGTCELNASNSALAVTANGTPDTQAKLERVIGDHLTRFAFREAPVLSWHRFN